MTPSEAVHRSLHAEFRDRLLPAYRTQMEEASAIGALDAALDQELRRIDDLDFATSFAASIGLGASVDYLPRILEIDGALLLCGIRFFGGDRHRAFVDLIAGEALAGDCTRAAIAAMRAYSSLRPTRARMLVPGPDAPRVRSGWRVDADQVLAMAPASVIAGIASPRTDAIDLVPASPDEAAAFVQSGYARVAKADPALGARLFPSTIEELGTCQADGYLGWWTIRGQRAGLIAARYDEVLGVKGLLMVEEIVAPQFAGRGTAALAQRELAKRACSSRADTMIVGTIDATNAPSRATARRAGRSEVASWHFLVETSAAPGRHRAMGDEDAPC
jgi:hypothetical protein